MTTDKKDNGFDNNSLLLVPEEDFLLSKPLYFLSLRSLSSIGEYVFLVLFHDNDDDD